jgi:hypothetical protein
VCKSAGCAIYGTKEEVIERIITHITKELDIREEEGETVEEPLPVEEKKLQVEAFKKLLKTLTITELYQISSSLKGVKSSGTKEERITNLWDSPYSEITILSRLRHQELSEICARKTLLKSGSKSDLIERLVESVQVKEPDVGEVFPPGDEKKIREIPKERKTEADLKDDFPEFPVINKSYPELTRDEKVVLSALIDMKSLNENELDRMITSYKLGWFLPKAHINELREKLNSLNKGHAIDIKPYKYCDIYEVVT